MPDKKWRCEEQREVSTVEEEERKRLQKVLFNVSYGLYVISSVKGEKINGQCANSFFQVTSQPLQTAVGINHENLTHEFIKHSGVFSATFLAEDDYQQVMRFGYRSGRDFDKFAKVDFFRGEKTGCPVIKGCLGYVECEVDAEKTVDLGTHTLFVARVVGGESMKEGIPLTYARYREIKKEMKSK